MSGVRPEARVAKVIGGLWQLGAWSTAEIARMMRLPEATVANELARQREDCLAKTGQKQGAVE